MSASMRINIHSYVACPLSLSSAVCTILDILQETSLLCEKKDKIIQLFDTLLAKLGGEELSANITYGKVSNTHGAPRTGYN